MIPAAPLPEPVGVMAMLQPYCPINLTTETFWTIVGHVNTALKKRGLHTAAAEFRSYVELMDHDTGWLYMVAQSFVRTVTPEEETADGRG